MIPKILLLAPTGRIGSSALSALLPLATAGKIHLALGHRQSTDLAKLPPSLERRVFDAEAEPQSLATVLGGFDIVISAIGATGDINVRLVRALAHVPTIKAFVSADFWPVWTESDEANPNIGQLRAKVDARAEADKLGVPVVDIKTGLFDSLFWGVPSFGVDLKGNLLNAYKDSLNQPFPTTSVEYVGAGIAELVTRDPATYAGKQVEIVERFVTGAQVAASLKAVHSGVEPEVREWSPGDMEDALASSSSALTKFWLKNWGEGLFKHGYDGMVHVDVPGWKMLPLEAVATQSMLEPASE